MQVVRIQASLVGVQSFVPLPSRANSWVKGTEPKPINWYAGKQYDTDIGNAKKALENVS